MNKQKYMKWVMELCNQEYCGHINSCYTNILKNKEVRLL